MSDEMESSATDLGSAQGGDTAGDAIAKIDGDQIAIRVDASLLKSAAESAEFARDPESGEAIFRITDANKFAQIVCRELNDDTAEDGLTRIQHLLDHCIEKAAEDGSECAQFKFKGKWS